MGGGCDNKPVTNQILEYENRQLYYIRNNTPTKYKLNNIRIN
jgi:hypothetical protein